MDDASNELSERQKKRDRAWRRKHAGEIIKANVIADKQARREAERVAVELSQLAAAGTGDESRTARRARERAQQKSEGRRLRLLQRDDDYVRTLLEEKRGIEGMANSIRCVD